MPFDDARILEELNISDIMIILGRKGFGKTSVAISYSMEKLKKGDYKKVSIIKNTGELSFKNKRLEGFSDVFVYPDLIDIYNHVEEIIGREEFITKYISEAIVITPIDYLGSISLDSSLVIFDEIQKGSIKRIISFIEGRGYSNRIIITSDLEEDKEEPEFVKSIKRAIQETHSTRKLTIAYINGSEHNEAHNVEFEYFSAEKKQIKELGKPHKLKFTKINKKTNNGADFINDNKTEQILPNSIDIQSIVEPKLEHFGLDKIVSVPMEIKNKETGSIEKIMLEFKQVGGHLELVNPDELEKARGECEKVVKISDAIKQSEDDIILVENETKSEKVEIELEIDSEELIVRAELLAEEEFKRREEEQKIQDEIERAELLTKAQEMADAKWQRKLEDRVRKEALEKEEIRRQAEIRAREQLLEELKTGIKTPLLNKRTYIEEIKSDIEELESDTEELEIDTEKIKSDIEDLESVSKEHENKAEEHENEADENKAEVHENEAEEDENETVEKVFQNLGKDSAKSAEDSEFWGFTSKIDSTENELILPDRDEICIEEDEEFVKEKDEPEKIESDFWGSVKLTPFIEEKINDEESFECKPNNKKKSKSIATDEQKTGKRVEHPIEEKKSKNLDGTSKEESKEKTVHRRRAEDNLPSNRNSNVTSTVQTTQKQNNAQGRNRYIVGRLAGEDLYDSNDEVIIRKGAEITTEIIDQANKEGLLAELIMYMTLPGLEG